MQPADVLLRRAMLVPENTQASAVPTPDVLGLQHVFVDPSPAQPTSCPLNALSCRNTNPCVYLDKTAFSTQSLTGTLYASLFAHLRTPTRPLSLTEASNFMLGLVLAQQHALCAATMFCLSTRAQDMTGHGARYLGAIIAGYNVFRVSAMFYAATLVQEQRRHHKRYLISSVASLVSTVSMLHLLCVWADIRLDTCLLPPRMLR